MGKKKGWIGTFLVGTLAGSMVFSSCAFADAYDELTEIMENQQELWEEEENESLLEKTLGLKELGASIEENGLYFQLRGGVTEQTAKAFGLSQSDLELCQILLELQNDPKLEKWLFDAAIGPEEDTFLDLSLYGDKEQLAVSVPQLFAGAVALKAGNIGEQYNQSALRQLMGENDTLPDFELHFYPDDSKDADHDWPAEELTEKIEALAEELADEMRAEKREEDSNTVYTLYVPTRKAGDIYVEIYSAYVNAFVSYGLVSVYDANLFENELQTMSDQMVALYGEEMPVDFYVHDGLLEKIGCEWYMDTSAVNGAADNGETEMPDAFADDAASGADEATASEEAEEAATEVQEFTAEEAGVVHIEADTEVSDFKGSMSYELEWLDPKMPSRGFTCSMYVEEERTGDTAGGTMRYETVDSQDKMRRDTTLALELSENGSVIYSGEPFHMMYDAASGAYQASFEVEAEGSTVGFYLDGTLEKLTDRTGIVCKIDRLAMGVDGDEIGVTGEMTIAGNIDAIETPENPRVLLEMNEGSLMGLLTEISTNLENMETQESESEEVYGESAALTDESFLSVISG